MMDKAFALMPKREVYENTGIQFMQLNSLYQLRNAWIPTRAHGRYPCSKPWVFRAPSSPLSANRGSRWDRCSLRLRERSLRVNCP